MKERDNKRGEIMVPQWRQKQRGSGCPQPMVRQCERGCHAMGPCLFNHVQLHFMQRDYFAGNGNQTSSTAHCSGLKPDTHSKDTLLILVQSSVLRWPWIMEISVITTSGDSHHFPVHTLGMWIQFIQALIWDLYLMLAKCVVIPEAKWSIGPLSVVHGPWLLICSHQGNENKALTEGLFRNGRL